MHDASVNAWLRRETPKHVELLTKLRDRLVRTLDPQLDDPDADGRERWIPADVNESGTPSRDWCRCYQRYQSGYMQLLQEERERTKMQLLAKRAGMAALTDDEYEREMVELGREAVRELSTDELAKEFLRRGMSLPVGEGDPSGES